MSDATARLPAICRDCGLVFESGYAVGAGAKMFMMGCTSGPCPNCGGTGDVPDALWRLVPQLLQVATESRPTITDLTNLEILVRQQMRQTIDFDVLTAHVKAEAPTTLPLLKALRDPAAQSIIGLAALLVSVAALLVSLGMGSVTPEQEPVQQPHHHEHRSDDGQRGPEAEDKKDGDHQSGQK